MNTERTPEWAYHWCWYFFGMGVATLIIAVGSLFLIPQLGLGVTLIYCAALLIQAATSFTFFYMCRNSLKGTNDNPKWLAAQFSH